MSKRRKNQTSERSSLDKALSILESKNKLSITKGYQTTCHTI